MTGRFSGGNMIDIKFKRHGRNTDMGAEVVEVEIIPLTDEEHVKLVQDWQKRQLDLIRKNMKETKNE